MFPALADSPSRLQSSVTEAPFPWLERNYHAKGQSRVEKVD